MHRSRWTRDLTTLAACVTVIGSNAHAASGNVDLPRYPSISPDGEFVVFSWRGDLWKAPVRTGRAIRLTNHPGDDLHSAWSRDGQRLAFDSDRDGYFNLYLMNADGTDARQVTHLDGDGRLAAFGLDESGQEILTLDASIEGDVYRANRPYGVPIAGGDPTRLHNAFGERPVVSPDGRYVAFTRGASSWSRRGYRGPDAREVWIFDRHTGDFRRITTWEGNDGQARWLDDDTLLYLSDQSLNRVNLHSIDIAEGSTPARLTSFDDVDVESFDYAPDARRVVLVAWDTLYTLDLDSLGAQPAPVELYANEDQIDNHRIVPVSTQVTEAALSPDGQVMAYVAYGEIFVRNVDPLSPTRRVTHSHAREKDIAWSPDGVRLYFVTDADGTDSIHAATVELTRAEVQSTYDSTLKSHDATAADGDQTVPPAARAMAQLIRDSIGGLLGDDANDLDHLPRELDPRRWHDALTFDIKPIVDGKTNDRQPVPSPDGRYLSFRRGLGDLVILDLRTGEERPLVSGWDWGLEWRFSPDGRYIAYAQANLNFNTDIWIVSTDGSREPVNVTRHPDNEINPRWSADGKVLAFLSERIEEQYDVWMVFLDKQLEALSTHELKRYYDQAAEAATHREPIRPVRLFEGAGPARDSRGFESVNRFKGGQAPPLDLDDAYLRVRRVTSFAGSESDLEISPGGDRYFVNATGDVNGLFSIRWDGGDQQRLGDVADVQHVSLTGDRLVFVYHGRAAAITPADGRYEFIDIDDEIRVDLAKQSSQKFLEAARTVGEMFYRADMKGVDWDALTARYHELARSARTADEFNFVANRLLGELNASHLGIHAPSDGLPNAQPVGRLGIVHRRTDDGYEVVEIIPESPADIGSMRLEVGDVITAVQKQPIEPGETLNERLRGTIGEEILLTVRRPLDDGPTVELPVLITPISAGYERELKYRAWRRRNSELVERWSGGRLGYVHIEGMNQESLDLFERDLYAAAEGRDGLIIDVRNNGGGWTTDRLLASLMYPRHSYTIPRGAGTDDASGYPQDRLFIQRYDLPIATLCNEKSFSNAEIFSHAIKTLNRGTLVGQQTYGGVISTGGTRLIDGTFVRLPFRGWYNLDGQDLENNGAMPDVLVPQTPQAEARGDDEQLRAAVENLLKNLEPNLVKSNNRPLAQARSARDASTGADSFWEQ